MKIICGRKKRERDIERDMWIHVKEKYKQVHKFFLRTYILPNKKLYKYIPEHITCVSNFDSTEEGAKKMVNNISRFNNLEYLIWLERGCFCF